VIVCSVQDRFNLLQAGNISIRIRFFLYDKFLRSLPTYVSPLGEDLHGRGGIRNNSSHPLGYSSLWIQWMTLLQRLVPERLHAHHGHAML